MEIKFYKCKHCGQIITVIKRTGVPIICCGEPMTEIIAGTTEASLEKHIPLVKIDGNNVKVMVGEVQHPMITEHYIEWIVLQTKKGNQIKYLKPNDKPEVSFVITADDEVEAVYAYCNLHSLWKSEEFC